MFVDKERALFCALLAMTVGSLYAKAEVVFDFEQEPVGNTGRSVTFMQGDDLILVELDQSILYVTEPNLHQAGWGSQSLLLGGGTRRSPMTISFEQSIEYFSIEFGDYYGTKPDTVSIQVYSGIGGTGSLLHEEIITSLAAVDEGFVDSFSYHATDHQIVGLNRFQSVVIETAGSFGNPSLFFDNLGFTVPSPSTLSLLGVLGMAQTRRRRA